MNAVFFDLRDGHKDGFSVGHIAGRKLVADRVVELEGAAHSLHEDGVELLDYVEPHVQVVQSILLPVECQQVYFVGVLSVNHLENIGDVLDETCIVRFHYFDIDSGEGERRDVSCGLVEEDTAVRQEIAIVCI